MKSAVALAAIPLAFLAVSCGSVRAETCTIVSTDWDTSIVFHGPHARAACRNFAQGSGAYFAPGAARDGQIACIVERHGVTARVVGSDLMCTELVSAGYTPSGL